MDKFLEAYRGGMAGLMKRKSERFSPPADHSSHAKLFLSGCASAEPESASLGKFNCAGYSVAQSSIIQ
jgi:hypothetical protein